MRNKLINCVTIFNFRSFCKTCFRIFAYWNNKLIFWKCVPYILFLYSRWIYISFENMKEEKHHRNIYALHKQNQKQLLKARKFSASPSHEYFVYFKNSSIESHKIGIFAYLLCVFVCVYKLNEPHTYTKVSLHNFHHIKHFLFLPLSPLKLKERDPQILFIIIIHSVRLEAL